MFTHAIVGTDFSPGGEIVIRWLPTLGRLGTSRITLVHALDLTYPAAGMADFETGYRTHLEHLGDRVRAYGLETATELAWGSPDVEIARCATERGASLIVIGSRSHSRLADAFLGSVATGVLRHASVPVLVVRIAPGDGQGRESFAPATPAGFDRVVFPTDWSDTAERAFDQIEALAGEGRIRSFRLLHVRDEVEEARTGESTEPEDQAKLEILANRLRTAGATDVEIETTAGSPVRSIVRRAADHEGSLIVMGTHGRGFIGDAFLGGVSREVLRTSPSAVLLVPPER